MKKLVVLLVIALSMNVAFVSAKELGPKKSYMVTTNELSTLLNPAEYTGELEGDLVVKVKVMITEKNEIIVLETNTENEALKTYIEKNLNYIKLTSNELSPGKKYVFDINFKS
jgi:recombinational DNA repair protein RecR